MRDTLEGKAEREFCSFWMARTDIDFTCTELETRSQSVEAALIAQHALTEVTAVGLASQVNRDHGACALILARSQEETTVVGRVCCEGEGKLNYLSLVLEGGMETSNSARVKLDVQVPTDCTFWDS